MPNRNRLSSVAFFVLNLLIVLLGQSRAGAESPAGAVLTVEGTAYLGRHGGARPQLVSFQGDVLAGDSLETHRAARVKVLLPDDVLVTVGEHSRVEVAQLASRTQPSTIRVSRGLVRINAGDTTTMLVDTPAASLTIRGGYVVLWVAEQVPVPLPGHLPLPGATGIWHMGQRGAVEVTAAGGRVRLEPGQAISFEAGKALRRVSPAEMPGLRTVMDATELKDVAKEESARELLLSLSPPGAALWTLPAVISGAAKTNGSGPDISGATTPAASAQPTAVPSSAVPGPGGNTPATGPTGPAPSGPGLLSTPKPLVPFPLAITPVVGQLKGH